MYIVKTPCGKEVIFDSEESAPKRKLNLNSSGYARYTCLVSSSPRKYKTILVHRLIAKAGPGLVVDHVNGNKLDNRVNNLRVITQSQNTSNWTTGRGRSRFRGVEIYKNSKGIDVIGSRFRFYNYSFCLGFFKTEEEAARMHDMIKLSFFGKIKIYTNFSDSTNFDFVKTTKDHLLGLIVNGKKTKKRFKQYDFFCKKMEELHGK